jgi:hypothetical protein
MWVEKVDATAFATHIFFLALHLQAPLFLSHMLFILSKAEQATYSKLRDTRSLNHALGQAFRALDGLSPRRRAHAQRPPENESYLIHGQR